MGIIIISNSFRILKWSNYFNEILFRKVLKMFNILLKVKKFYELKALKMTNFN